MLDVLRRSKPLIVVPNSSLLDDHQTDLALALSSQNYLVSSTVEYVRSERRLQGTALTRLEAH